jgi:hypothetical protein
MRNHYGFKLHCFWILDCTGCSMHEDRIRNSLHICSLTALMRLHTPLPENTSLTIRWPGYIGWIAGMIHSTVKNFSFALCLDTLWSPLCLLSSGYRVLSLQSYRHRADHTPPSHTEVNNASCCTYTILRNLVAWSLIKYRHNISFIFSVK